MKPIIAAFLAGTTVMAFEILASRWLAPAFGFTLQPWAVLLSVPLLFSSAGAWVGGYTTRMRTAWALSASAMWLALCGGFASAVMDALIPFPMLLGTCLAAILLLSVPTFLLGMVIPLAAGSSGTRGRTPRIVGRLVAASTAGSLVGTLGTALFLIPHCGLRLGAVTLAIAIAFLTWLASDSRSVGALSIIAIIASIGILAPAQPVDPRTIERLQTAYGTLDVVETRDGIAIRVDGINQGAASPWLLGRGALLAHGQLVELLPWMRPTGTRALQIGLGGAITPRCLADYGIEVETIEINAGLVDAVRRHFGYDGRVIIGDGRAVLRRLNTTYDFLILDAFQGETVPAHLLSLEAFSEMRARLSPSGIVCVHLISKPRHETTAAIAATMKRAFERVHCYAARGGSALQDLFLFASNGPLITAGWSQTVLDTGFRESARFEPPVANHLTDDENPFETMYAAIGRELRRVGDA